MKYIVFDIIRPLIHNDSGVAFNTRHIHERRTMQLSELMIINEGEIFLRHLEPYHLKKNDVLFLPQGIEHYGTRPSDCRLHFHHFVIPYDFSIVGEEQASILAADSNLAVLPMQHSLKNSAATMMLSNQLQQYSGHIPSTTLARNSLLMAIIGEILVDFRVNDSNIGHKRLHSMLNYIDNNFPHYDISVKSLAENFGYNEKYIAFLFKKYVGVTPSRYIIAAKMHEARNLLINTTDSVNTIALNLNYENVHYFYRQFKAFFGATPSQVRSRYTKTHEITLSPKDE